MIPCFIQKFNEIDSNTKKNFSPSGEPNIPEKPTLRLVDGVLQVTWNKVIGSPDHYFVKYKRSDKKQWLRSGEISHLSKLKYEIYNVVHGETYNVRIVAENKHGIKEGEVADAYVPTEKCKYFQPVQSFLIDQVLLQWKYLKKIMQRQCLRNNRVCVTLS